MHTLILDALEATAARLPEKTAFVDAESSVTFAQLTGLSRAAGSALTALFTTRTAVSFLVFTLLYTPCVAAIAAIRREVGSSLRAATIALTQCCVAWLVSFVVFSAAQLL